MRKAITELTEPEHPWMAALKGTWKVEPVRRIQFTCDQCGKQEYEEGIRGWWALFMEGVKVTFFPCDSSKIPASFHLCGTPCLLQAIGKCAEGIIAAMVTGKLTGEDGEKKDEDDYEGKGGVYAGKIAAVKRAARSELLKRMADQAMKSTQTTETTGIAESIRKYQEITKANSPNIPKGES